MGIDYIFVGQFLQIKVDKKGRIVLPIDLRKRLDINEGDLLQMDITSNKIIIEKTENPFKKLDELIGDVKFDPKNRKKIESLAINMVTENE